MSCPAAYTSHHTDRSLCLGFRITCMHGKAPKKRNFVCEFCNGNVFCMERERVSLKSRRETRGRKSKNERGVERKTRR